MTDAITVRQLMALGACREGVEWVAACYPEGYEGTWLELAGEPGCRPDWYGWVAAHAPDISLDDRERLANATERPVTWLRTIAARAPGLTRADREWLVERARQELARRAAGVECGRCAMPVSQEHEKEARGSGDRAGHSREYLYVETQDEYCCWYCQGPLCYRCWDEHGHCGHREAEAENERAHARTATGQEAR